MDRPWSIPFKLYNAMVFKKPMSYDDTADLGTYIHRVTRAANHYQHELITLQEENRKLRLENAFLISQLQEDEDVTCGND